MPVDYSLGKIYKIVGNGRVYVGSTCEPLLCRRLAGHKKNYNFWLNEKGNYITSFECLEDPECKIELLEMCPCSTKDELRKCEGKWIRDLECVNKLVAGRTKMEYCEANKEAILQRNKAYREANKEAILQRNKAYQEANKEAILQQKKAYYEANKEAIKEKEMVRYWEKKAEK